MIRYTTIHDKAVPARLRVVDADKAKPARCIHSRPMVPRGKRHELDVTICPACDYEAPWVNEKPGDIGHGD